MESDEPESAVVQEGKYLIDGSLKYSPYGHGIWFYATDLSVGHTIDEKGESLVSWIFGSATIEGRALELIGFKGKGSRKLDLTINASTAEELTKFADAFWGGLSQQKDSRKYSTEIPSQVSLWFSAGDWELDTDDTWYIALRLNKLALAEIEHLIMLKRISALSFRASLLGIYSDAEYAPLSFPKIFGVRKGKYGSSDPVIGQLSVLRINEHPVALSVASRDAGDDQILDTVAESNHSDIASAGSKSEQLDANLAELAKQFAKATTYLKGIIIALTLIALILAFRN